MNQITSMPRSASPGIARPPVRPTVVVVSERVQREPKYWPSLERYIQRFRSASYLVRSWDEATERALLEDAPVDYVRIHSVARRDDGTALCNPSQQRVRHLLRSGRLLSRDAFVLTRALEALEAGARSVRLGSLRSLSQETATEIT